MDDLNRKRHAVYKLTYHAVFVIKYRRRVMTEPIITHMRQYATHLIEQCYQGKLLELNGEPDHIHILFELPATAAPSVVVCSLKTQLSKEVRAKFWNDIKDKLWNEVFCGELDRIAIFAMCTTTIPIEYRNKNLYNMYKQITDDSEREEEHYGNDTEMVWFRI